MIKRLKYRKWKKIIQKSGLFDLKHYLFAYPDVRYKELDPITHYIKYGAQEGRNPNKDFDTNAYLNNNPDVKASKLNPFVHYILYGKKEHRRFTPMDVGGYLQSNPQLIKKGINSLLHNGVAGTFKKVKCKLNSDLVHQVGFENTKAYFQPLPLSQKVQKDSFKIAVVIHAFYIDVLEDIISSIDNISPKPDLFVSISMDADKNEVETFLTAKGYKYKVCVVQNRGRDVAPFLVEFAKELKDYDLCCKIHGKKSLYTGSEQSQWRNHIYNNLLGSKEIVDDILSAFSQNKNLGLVFSDSFNMIPYWGYTWLTNKPAVVDLLHKLKLTPLLSLLEKSYIDFPAGTMFWFRPQAIKQIVESALKYEDFPEEPIANDGTIAHALERLFAYVARYNEYDFIELNYQRGVYTQNYCHKNFNQFKMKTSGNAKNTILDSEYVIFDIFDTLLTRNIFYPDNLFRMLEHKIDKKFSLKSDFFKVRKQIEGELRQDLQRGKDVSYSDIYDRMDQKKCYEPAVVSFARENELHYELECLKVKPEVVELLHFSQKNKKKIIFVSDMYLEKKDIEKIFTRLHIDIKDVSLYVSSQTGLRKDNDTIWQYLIEKKLIKPEKTVMFGDNELSDAKKAGDVSIKHVFHLFSEKNCFFQSPIGEEFQDQFSTIDEKSMILLGPAVNYLFDSPLLLEERVLQFNKKLSPYEFGYIALAPFLYLYMSHLYANHKGKRLFFLARDGYFLKKIYEFFLQTKQITDQSSPEYLLISRRAILGATLKDETSLKHMVLELGPFQGKLSELIYNRIGLDRSFLKECTLEDFSISNKEDLHKAYKLLREHIDTINKHTNQEYKSYQEYLKRMKFYDTKKVVVVDLGYSGTIQNYLHKLTNQVIKGEYLVTTCRVKDVESQESSYHGYFVDKVDFEHNTSNPIYKYSLLLEAYLTSDKGQLVCFSKENQPVYKKIDNNITKQQRMTDGVMDYIKEMSLLDVDLLDSSDEELKRVSTFLFDFFVSHRFIDDELSSLFHLEDDFTGNKSLDILSVLAKRGV